MSRDINEKIGNLKKRTRKVHRKAKFVGALYFIATVFVAVMAFFPLTYGTSVGTMSVLNFWKPFLQMFSIKDSMLPIGVNIAVAALYGILLLSVVINVLRMLAKFGKLSGKRISDKKGPNRGVNRNINRKWKLWMKWGKSSPVHIAYLSYFCL